MSSTSFRWYLQEQAAMFLICLYCSVWGLLLGSLLPVSAAAVVHSKIIWPGHATWQRREEERRQKGRRVETERNGVTEREGGMFHLIHSHSCVSWTAQTAPILSSPLFITLQTHFKSQPQTSFLGTDGSIYPESRLIHPTGASHTSQWLGDVDTLQGRRMLCIFLWIK